MKIAILGYGIEGRSAYRYLSAQNPKAEIDVFDEHLSEADIDIRKVDSFQDINFAQYVVIVRSPSVRPDEIRAKIIADKGADMDFNLTSSTQIFFDKCPAPIIGVTGTKGKGTTASFIYEILRAAGQTVHLVGNIGRPAIDELPKIVADDIVVYELSSFQLWDLQKSPHIAVLTILEPDHMDVHTDFDEYVGAKENIVKYQTTDDFVVYNKNDRGIVKIAEESAGQKLPYPNDGFPGIENWVKIAGYYNVDNAIAAATAVRAILPDISMTIIEKGVSSFTGLAHRLKLVRIVDGVQYYDNSIATTPGSAISAIKSFTQPKILILGGSDKDVDYQEIGAAAEDDNVRQIFAIGANRDKVKSQVSEKYSGKITLLDSQNMAEIVKIIAESAQLGDVVILSPAAASFDMFKSYSDRGDQFVAAVESL
ncbi:UDP-N-acetylmuramoylalanine--D-glutamate ligase [Alphaproteobacteria bacterium]|nr:UDP-N-acetylmuramoylalanine--D-glutamate ligase [Alphaproteobacteria bacterium]